jgi:hypothetical protein
MIPENVGWAAVGKSPDGNTRYASTRYSILSLKVLVNTSLPLLNMPKVAS